jgi:hypothetical protein
MGKIGNADSSHNLNNTNNIVETSQDPTIFLEALVTKHSKNMQQISGVKFPDANYTLNQGQKIDTMKPNH